MQLPAGQADICFIGNTGLRKQGWVGITFKLVLGGSFMHQRTHPNILYLANKLNQVICLRTFHGAATSPTGCGGARTRNKCTSSSGR